MGVFFVLRHYSAKVALDYSAPLELFFKLGDMGKLQRQLPQRRLPLPPLPLGNFPARFIVMRRFVVFFFADFDVNEVAIDEVSVNDVVVGKNVDDPVYKAHIYFLSSTTSTSTAW